MTLQYPMAWPGLANHKLAGFCALSLPSATSSSGTLHKPAKPHPPQTTCPTLPKHPGQAPPRLLPTAEAAFDLAVPNNKPRAGYSHKLPGLCALWLLSAASSSGNFHKQPATPHPQRTTCTVLPQQPPVQGPPLLLYTQEAAFELAVPLGMPRAGHLHTGTAL